MSQSYKPPLPSNDDTEFWDGDKNVIDKKNLLNEICSRGQHDMKIDFENRDATCEKCGWGFMFQTHLTDFIDGKLVDRETQKVLY